VLCMFGLCVWCECSCYLWECVFCVRCVCVVLCMCVCLCGVYMCGWVFCVRVLIVFDVCNFVGVFLCCLFVCCVLLFVCYVSFWFVLFV